MKRKYFLIATLLVLSVGCEGLTPEAVDVDAERAAILAADQAWSDTVGDLEVFVSFFADDARFLPPDGPQANGRDEIQQSFSALAALPGFSLSWGANFSDVSSSGDLGYSVGTFEMTVDGPDGDPATRTGTYTTVWKKQNDGQWKVVSDIPNFDSPALPNESTAADNEAVIREVLELINDRNLDEAFELYALDYIYHGPGDTELRGRDGIRGLWEVFLTGFPDLRSTVDDIVSERDKLVLRWTIQGTHTGEFLGVAATGNEMTLQLTEIFRFADGQLVEAWDQYDRLGLMQQIGALP